MERAALRGERPSGDWVGGTGAYASAAIQCRDVVAEDLDLLGQAHMVVASLGLGGARLLEHGHRSLRMIAEFTQVFVLTAELLLERFKGESQGAD